MNGNDTSTKTRTLSDSLTREEQLLVRRLIKIHGPAVFSDEESGLHMQVCSPWALERFGLEELRKKHLSINLALHFGRMSEASLRHRGETGRTFKKLNRDRCALCLKTSRPATMTELLQFEDLEVRVRRLGGVTETTDDLADINLPNRQIHLIDDGYGHQIPDHPGQVTPLAQLPEGHVALDYLRDRGFTQLDRLEQLARVGYCWQSRAEEKGRGYLRLANGFKREGAGRIIFYVDNDGIQQGWQGRAFDKVIDGVRYWYCYRRNAYVPCEREVDVTTLQGVKRSWRLLDNPEEPMDMPKYWWGPGCLRKLILLGLDAARRYNHALGLKKRACIIVEGPLDAGKFGPPAIALCGKSLSDYHAKLIALHFDRVLLIPDVDEAGGKMEESVRMRLGERVLLDVRKLPDGIKDAGSKEFTYEKADAMWANFLQATGGI